MKKILTIVLAITMLAAMLQIQAFAAYDSSNPPVIKNVSFFSDGDEIFEVPEAGSTVSAKVYLENTVEQTAAVILASYADNTLEKLVVNPETSIIVGYPTITLSSVEIAEDTDRISVYVWSDMESITPITSSSVLGKENGNAKLGSYAVTLTDDSGSKTFNGDINHDEKTVDVYVPTIDIKNAGLTDVKTEEKANGANGYTSLFNNANFENAVKSATFAATAADEDATVIEKGTADFSNAQTITVTAANGTVCSYAVEVHPTGYVVNSNFNSTTLNYASEDNITVDTENSWKYQTSKYCTIANNRALTPANASSTGFWQYNANNLVIKDGKRYTKADYEQTNVPASEELFYSRIYADISKSATNASDRYIDLVVNNIRADGTATSHAKLKYTYANNTFNTIKDDLNTSIASFDFTMKSGSKGSSGVYYSSGLGDLAVRLQDDTGLYKIEARAHNSDNSFSGKTSSAYSAFKLLNNKVGEWHNVKMITKDMGAFVDGKKLVHTAYYIDGEYAGYTYSTDQYDSLWISNSTDCPGFQAFYNAECVFAFDNYFTGYCYQ